MSRGPSASPSAQERAAREQSVTPARRCQQAEPAEWLVRRSFLTALHVVPDGMISRQPNLGDWRAGRRLEVEVTHAAAGCAQADGGPLVRG
jgi:hypothetical protein